MQDKKCTPKEAARRVFSERGYKAASVAEMAGEAHMARAASTTTTPPRTRYSQRSASRRTTACASRWLTRWAGRPSRCS
ncbi:TetR family transcriptional regulator [uncultured Propionibacterium sp.]|uniref:TetR family transcriptional regulator n=1 Tax=uncultured Propionibacterium sp. TaxID=218066 RepID=UPI0037DDBB6E